MVFFVSEFEKTEILGSKVSLMQPKRGYRVAIDPILLAASVPAKTGEKVLDVGSGTGASSLALAARLPGISCHGIEVQEKYADISNENAKQNKAQNRVHFFFGDIAAPPKNFKPDNYNHVMTNPPYLEYNHQRRSDIVEKRLATMESNVSLTDWIKFCVRSVKSKGTVTIIHRADRLEKILESLNGKVGDLIIFPFWSTKKSSNENYSAKRVIIQGRKGVRAPTQLKSGLVLHNDEGGFSEIADQILTKARGLDLNGSRMIP